MVERKSIGEELCEIEDYSFWVTCVANADHEVVEAELTNRQLSGEVDRSLRVLVETTGKVYLVFSWESTDVLASVYEGEASFPLNTVVKSEVPMEQLSVRKRQIGILVSGEAS